MADVMGAGANLMNLGRTGLAALTGDTTQAAQAGVTRQEELQKRYKSGFDPEKITAPFEQGQYGTAAGEALKQVPSAVATVAPSVLQTASLAAAGRLGGGALGSFFGPVGTVAGAQVGQYALPAVVGFIQALGGQAQEKVQTQKEAGEKPDVDALALAPYAAGSAALDLIGAKVAMPSFFKKMGGQKVAEETADAAAAAARSALIANARKVAGRGTFDTILRGTGGFALGELPTEVLQDVVDRAAVGKSLTDDEAMKSYRSTALMTVLAAPIGAGVGVSGRSGARTTVEQEDKQLAAQAAQEAEAAKNTPDALAQLDAQYQDATRRMGALQKIIDVKPTKASTPEEKQAHAEAKQEMTKLRTENAPVLAEYAKRKDAIGQMQDAQLADIEQKAAEGQPTAAATTPSGVSPVPMPKLLERYDQLRGDLDTVETQLAAGPSLEEQAALSQQRQQLKQQTDSYGQLIEQRGGVAMTATEHTQAVKEADAALAREDAARKKLLNEGEFDAADKQATKIAELMQQRQELVGKRPQIQEYAAYKESAPGETQQMFAEEEMPAPVEQKPLTYVSEEGKEITPPAPETAAPVSTEVITAGVDQKVQAANEELATAVESKNTEAVNVALRKINEAEAERSRAVAPKLETLEGKLDKSVWDIFSPHNVIATAIGNNDKRTLDTLARAEDRRKLDALANRTAEENRIRGLLDERFGLGGTQKAATKKGEKVPSGQPMRSVKRERADLFSQLYDQKSQSAFKNGNSQEFVLQPKERIQKKPRISKSGDPVLDRNGKPVVDEIMVPVLDSKGLPEFEKISLQEIYDKQGVAAVEMAVVMDKIRDLRKKVEMPQGNAKTSLYQKLLDLSAEHEALLEQKGIGLASPTMGEKVAGAQAKLGKGEAPAAREMDASEKYNLNRRLTSLENQYNAALGQVAPIRQKIDETYASLYKEVPLETVEAEREAKKALLLPETGARSMSRTARTQARIASGDVRKEAETSQKMRDLARDLGTEEADYKKFEKAQLDRYTKLKAKYGQYDPAVATFQRNMAEELNTKAMELGKATPEYKATLKEQLEVTKEALAGSKQTLKSKRGTQTTRKVSLAKKEEATGSPESRAVGAKRHMGKAMSVAEQERVMKEVNDSEGGTAYRLREGDTSKTVDSAEAQKIIDGLKLPENVKFVYAPTAGKIPVRLLNMMAAEGVDPNEGMVQGAVFSDGTVLVVGDQHTDVTDLEKTIAHEIIGHYGVDTVIGLDVLNAYAKKTDVIALAEQIGGKGLVAEVMQTVRANAAMGRSEEVQKLQALREIIAHTEEARVTEAFREKAGRWMKELVGMVRAGLRAMGLQNAGALSTSDVFYMLKQSRKAFENKTVGVYRDKAGQIAFRSRRTPGEFDADPEPSAVDTFLGNALGLAGRMQLVDKFAAVSGAFKAGMSKGVLTDVEAGNAEFLMRFGEHRSQYATQILTNGPLALVTTKTDKGIEHTYKSTKGANALQMAEALSKGGFANDSEAEGLLTLVTSGERAKQVGWAKLNYSDPAGAEVKYKRALAHLDANPKQKDAIKEAMAIYQKFNAGQMDFLVQVGELTAAKAAELKAITYVPFYRVNANGEVQLMIDKERPVRIGNIKDEPQLQQLVGDNKQIMPIFASMVQNTFMLTNLGLRNQSVKETAFALRKIGIASRIGQGPGPTGPSTVRFKKNGVDMHVVIDTDMYGIPAKYIVEGMEGIKTTIPAVVKLLGIPADILRKFVTRAPPYAIRQTIRDPLNAWLTTGTDAFPVLSSFKELASMVAGRSETERTLMESGAVSSNVFTGDERDMGKVLREITSGKAGWTKLLAKADAFALQGDTATRAVIYKDSIAKGMSHQQALLRSVESMNFSRRGLSPSIQMLSTMIPFFNAQIQGLDVLYRAFKGDMSHNEQLKIREKLFQRGLLLAVGTMAYAAAMQDDEAYKRAKPEERYGNWFVYIPGVSEPLRIPIPFELGYLFKSLPEAVYNMAAGDEKASTAVKGIGTLLAQSNPFALPQAIKPLTEVVLGKSFFSGDIESEREKQVMPTDRYRDSSTEVAKILGSVTGNVGLSPIKIDYLIRGYTGGLGIALVQLANPLLNTEAAAEVEKPSMKPSKMPFIGGLFQPVEGRGTLDSAYDKMTEIQQVKGTYNKLIEDGKRAEAQSFAQEYANQLALVSTSGSVQKALGEMAKQERFIKASPKLTTEQKDAALERLDKMKVAYARQFLTLADRTTPR
jgi:hypothetical protein